MAVRKQGAGNWKMCEKVVSSHFWGDQKIPKLRAFPPSFTLLLLPAKLSLITGTISLLMAISMVQLPRLLLPVLWLADRLLGWANVANHKAARRRTVGHYCPMETVALSTFTLMWLPLGQPNQCFRNSKLKCKYHICKDESRNVLWSMVLLVYLQVLPLVMTIPKEYLSKV